LGRKTRHNAIKIRVDWVAFKHPSHFWLFLSMSSSTFFHASFTEGWKCDFLARNTPRGPISPNKPRVSSGAHLASFTTRAVPSPFVPVEIRARASCNYGMLCSPNEDFGRMNKWCNVDFRLRFQWFVAQIEYSRSWKVLRKSALYRLFILPKSSFGRGKCT
jgi:hypothetical protein